MSVATNNAFVYNPKSEVTSTMMRNGTNTYSYDWAGNRTSAVTNSLYGVAYTPNGFNQYANVNGVSPTYDANGNLTAIPGTCSMAYDGRNQMTFYSNANDRVWNTYDHQGRRVLKVSHGGTETQSWEVAESRFLYDDWNLISELQYSSIPLFQYSIISFFRLGSPFSASAEPRVPKVFGAVLPNIPVFHLFHYSTPARLNCGKRLEPFGLVWYI